MRPEHCIWHRSHKVCECCRRMRQIADISHHSMARMLLAPRFPLHLLVNKLLAAEGSLHYGLVFFGSTGLWPEIGLIRFQLDLVRLEPGIYYAALKDTEGRRRLQAKRPQKCCLASGCCVFAFAFAFALYGRHTKCHKLILCGCASVCLLFTVLIAVAKIVNIILFSAGKSRK